MSSSGNTEKVGAGGHGSPEEEEAICSKPPDCLDHFISQCNDQKVLTEHAFRLELLFELLEFQLVPSSPEVEVRMGWRGIRAVHAFHQGCFLCVVLQLEGA